jgi:hypothetical protein
MAQSTSRTARSAPYWAASTSTRKSPSSKRLRSMRCRAVRLIALCSRRFTHSE